MTEPLTPEREQGIRLQQTMNFDPTVDVLLSAIDSLRSRIQGLTTELSVHERRVRVSKLSMFTEAEEAMLRFCIDAGYQIFLSNSATFTEADHKAIEYLREMVGP